MYQIKETDFLWKCYKRYYKYNDNGKVSTDPVEHPGNICSYFWKAIGGIGLWALWDLPVVFYVILAACLLHFSSSIAQLPSVVACSSAVAIVLSIIIVMLRSGFWAVENLTRETIEKLGLAFIIFIVIVLPSFAIGAVYSGDKLTLWPFFLGFVTWVGFIGICASFIWFYTSPTTTVARTYIQSWKDKACPLVKIPGEENPIVEKSNEQANSTVNSIS